MPAIDLVKTNAGVEDLDANGQDAGDKIVYSYTVTNTGNVTLTAVSLSDDLLGSITLLDTSLDPGESTTGTATEFLDQAQIDAGTVTNIATTTGTPPSGPNVTDVDTNTVSIDQNALLSITKTATVLGDADNIVDSPADDIEYTITVTNDGNVTLTNVLVTDPRSTNGGDVVGTVAVLAVGASETFTFVYDVQQYEIDANGTDASMVGDGDGDIDNTATATSDQAGPVDASAEVEVEQILPQAGVIDLEKYVSVDGGLTWDMADEAPGPTMVQGTGNPLFKFVMTNVSNVTATNVVLSDSDFDLDGLVSTVDTGSRPDSATDGPGGTDEVYSLDTLAPDETVEVIFSEAVWQAGQHENIAQVTYVLGTLTDFAVDPAHYFGELAITGPGVRTPGFWTNGNWQRFWDGIEGNEPNQSGQPNFPNGEITYPVDDPVGDDPGTPEPDLVTGLLIGDFNRDGYTGDNPQTAETEGPEETIYYSIEEALAILNANTRTLQQDARYILDRSLIATWLNYLAGNPITGGDSNPSTPAVEDVKYFIEEGIDWLQLLTPDENGDGAGDGALVGSERVPSSSPYWNSGINDTNYPGGGYSNTYDGPVDAGNAIHGALDEYNNFGTINGVQYAIDGGTVI